jgi:hypothetical protein
MDDITGQPETMNYVIYNPTKDSKNDRIIRLYDNVERRFGIQLRESDAYRLTDYDEFHLEEFVSDLKRVIQNYKK